jgi:hypothetical protein
VAGSFASRFFARHPEVRARIAATGEFAAVRERLPTVDVDGQQYYVVGGDMLRDEDEIALDWAREHGLVTQEEVDRLHAEEERGNG